MNLAQVTTVNQAGFAEYNTNVIRERHEITSPHPWMLASKTRTRPPDYTKTNVPGKINTGPRLAVNGSQSGAPLALRPHSLCVQSPSIVQRHRSNPMQESRKPLATSFCCCSTNCNICGARNHNANHLKIATVLDLLQTPRSEQWSRKTHCKIL